MDEYKSNQIKYERNSNKSNQIKYAAAEKRIQIIQIKYATCERIIFVWTPCILRCRYVASRNRPSTRNADNKMILPAIRATIVGARYIGPLFWVLNTGMAPGFTVSASQSKKYSNTTNQIRIRIQRFCGHKQIKIREYKYEYGPHDTNTNQIRALLGEYEYE